MYSENKRSAQENALDGYYNLMDSTGRSSEHLKTNLLNSLLVHDEVNY